MGSFEEKNVLKEKRLLISTIFCMIVLSMVIIFSVFFTERSNLEYLVPALQFIQLFNVIISILGVVSCLVCYRRTENDSIFIITLMYIGLSVGIACGHIDYLPFYYNELKLSTYIVVSASLLRLILLIIAAVPTSKIKDIIIKNKYISIITVIILKIISGAIERRIAVNMYSDSDYKFLVIYNVLLIIIYCAVSINLIIKAIKENEYIFVVLSSSIIILAIKAAYAIYLSTKLTFYTKLISVALTYMCFFMIIIGALIELFIYISKVNDLNDNLNLFYSMSENTKYTLVAIFDEYINLLYANKNARRYYKCDDLKKLESILRSKIEKCVEVKEITESINTKGSWRGTIRDEDNKRTLDLFIEVIMSKKNKRLLAVTYTDITEVLNAAIEIKKLKIYDKEKTEFIANVSHELKTPLNSIYSSIQLLDNLSKREDVDFNETYEKYNKVLQNNCNRMIRLINNTLDLSKIDMEVKKVNFANYNIVNIVEDVTLSVVKYAKLKEISIQFDTNEEEQILRCDSRMIERVILNLLSNAIKFSKNKSNIYVDLNISNNTTEIIIKDEGIGISKENQEIIFEKFVQVDKSFSRGNEGIGTGLSIVKAVVKLHEGEIKLESNLNEGTTFKVILPNIVIENENVEEYIVDEYNVKVELSDIYELYQHHS